MIGEKELLERIGNFKSIDIMHVHPYLSVSVISKTKFTFMYVLGLARSPGHLIINTNKVPF